MTHRKNNDRNQRNMSRLNLTLPKNINLIISYFEKKYLQNRFQPTNIKQIMYIHIFNVAIIALEISYQQIVCFPITIHFLSFWSPIVLATSLLTKNIYLLSKSQFDFFLQSNAWLSENENDKVEVF